MRRKKILKIVFYLGWYFGIFLLFIVECRLKFVLCLYYLGNNIFEIFWVWFCCYVKEIIFSYSNFVYFVYKFFCYRSFNFRGYIIDLSIGIVYFIVIYSVYFDYLFIFIVVFYLLESSFLCENGEFIWIYKDKNLWYN